MKSAMRRSLAATMIAAIVALAAFLDAGTASSQTCVVTRVFNNTTCTINLCLYDAGGAVNCYNIPPGGPTGIVLGAFVPVGVQSAGGVFHPFVAPPSPGCTRCIALPATVISCCGVVCYDAPSCQIRINPCGPPCTL